VTIDIAFVPQANRPELVLRIAEKAVSGPLHLSDIHDVLRAAGRGEFVERQALYYARAAENFSLIQNVDSRFSITELGMKITASTNRQERKLLLKTALFSNPLMVEIMENHSAFRPTRDSITQFLQSNTTLSESTCIRRSSSVFTFINEWLYGTSVDSSTLNSREWAVLLTSSGDPLPEWAQFFLDLGRISAIESSPSRKTWRLVTVPHRNMVASLFAAGFLEASIPSVLAHIDEFDICDVEEHAQITWKLNDEELVFGYFKQLDPPDSVHGRTFSYSRLKAGGLMDLWRRNIEKAREFQFAEFYGDPFVHPRPMTRNRPFFENFVGSRSEDLLCNSQGVICLAGRPKLREDLTTPEFRIGKRRGALDDLLRVRGVDDVDEVAHYLTDYISPDWDVSEETTPQCAVFDGQLTFPKLKHYITSDNNFIVLDRWDDASVASFSAFDVDRATKGCKARFKPAGLTVPKGVEYIEWTEEV
jgi:hypothetical protein